MKSMWPPLAVIFFMTFFTGQGAWAPPFGSATKLVTVFIAYYSDRENLFINVYFLICLSVYLFRV